MSTRPSFAYNAKICMMQSEEDLYLERTAYTLQLRDEEFMHQHVVDAYVAQHAEPHSRPMSVVFAPIGLHLYLDRGYTGRQVQRAHMLMAQQPEFRTLPVLPSEKPQVTVLDVMNEPPGVARDAMIRRWYQAVWQCWRPDHAAIAGIAERVLHR